MIASSYDYNIIHKHLRCRIVILQNNDLERGPYLTCDPLHVPKSLLKHTKWQRLRMDLRPLMLRVQGLGLRVWGSGFRVSGLGYFMSTPQAQPKGPKPKGACPIRSRPFLVWCSVSVVYGSLGLIGSRDILAESRHLNSTPSLRVDDALKILDH